MGACRRLLWVARGSLRETEHWILRAEERGLLEPGTAARIDEIARPLNGLIQKRRPYPYSVLPYFRTQAGFVAEISRL